MEETIVKSYHIETKDGIGVFHFFTQAKNNKEALRNLEKNSLDYKRLVKSDRDLIIKVTKL